jgi:hypothetical protein
MPSFRLLGCTEIISVVKPSESETPIVRFKGAAVRYGRAIENGSKAAATKSAREIRAARDLFLGSKRGSAELLELLDDADPWFQYAAAVSVISAHPERAISALHSLRSSSGSLGILAFTALKMQKTPSP